MNGSGHIVWLASYPKSGNTWVRFILANLLRGPVENSAAIEELVPDIHRGPLRDEPGSGDGLRVAKTHFTCEALPRAYQTTAAVCVLRHPLDVLVSHLNYLGIEEGSAAAERFIEQYLRDGGHAPWARLGFGTWCEHVESWILRPRPFRRLVVRYEELSKDPVGQTTRLCCFLGLGRSANEIAAACDRSSLAALRRLEDREVAGDEKGFFEYVRHRNNPTHRFIHRGVAGRYRAMLTQGQLAAAAARFGRVMRQVGYPPEALDEDVAAQLGATTAPGAVGAPIGQDGESQRRQPAAADAEQENDAEPLRLHIGGTQPKPGWKILNIQAGPHVDFVGSCTEMGQFPDDSALEVYASHVLEHLGYQHELPRALREIFRVLRPGGRLRASVPDMDVLCELFRSPHLTVDERFFVSRMMFGGQVDAHDFHKVGLNWEIMERFLRKAGFRDIRRVETFALFDDCSAIRRHGRLISLNIEAVK